MPHSVSCLWPPSVALSALLLSASPEDGSAFQIPTQDKMGSSFEYIHDELIGLTLFLKQRMHGAKIS